MIDFQLSTDCELVRLAQSGNSDAFGKLVVRHESKMYRLARSMAETQEDAEDILQEAFATAFSSISSFSGRSKFSTWLYRIVVNLALMKRRARKNVVQSLDAPVSTQSGEIPRDVGDKLSDPLGMLIAKESCEMLAGAVADMRPTNRDVFVLRHVEGLSIKEIGDLLNISLGTVKSRLYRARLSLREKLVRRARRETLAAGVFLARLAREDAQPIGLV